MVKIGDYFNSTKADQAVTRNKKRYKTVIKIKNKSRGYKRFTLYGYGRR